MSNSKRTAIVTGGTRGIGRAISERLVNDGFQVVAVFAHNRNKADELAKKIELDGGTLVSMQGDVADEEDMARVFAFAEKEFDGIDVVVHSAGIMTLSTVAELNMDELDRLHRTNIRGTFVVNKLAAQKVQSGGAIINLSTSVKKMALPKYAAYAASKGAVDALVPILAKELRGKDITVNAVAPGPTATDLFLEGKDEKLINQLALASPLERLGRPEDIADVVSLLATSGRWINGQVVYVNGGVI